MSLASEIERRRTFAIISHPDAGKTTLTEKFLLFGGAIQLAGHVRAKKDRRSTRSDWMEIEKERGISISSTALQFGYRDHVFNLLDTPGHQDFSEDTYRTLMAADSAIMVIDAAKGVEPQTRKLFTICKERGIPIVTFINKMDRPAQDPFTLIDEVEKLLGMAVIPRTWPLGSGPDFAGVYSFETQKVHMYERTTGGAHKAPVEVRGPDDPLIAEALDKETFEQFQEGVELVEGVLPPFDDEAFANGEMSPVYFGSALNSFGVEHLLDAYIASAPSPRPVTNTDGSEVAPDSPNFSAFVFKLQANMNKAHRDRVAFIRVVSGKFERGMDVTLVRTGKRVKLNSPVAFFGQERETIDEAFPGDVIGLINPGTFTVGDIIGAGEPPKFAPLPHFPPEMFARIVPVDTGKAKAFRKGIAELCEEGVVQIFNPTDAHPIVGAVGELQFQVFQSRIEAEYGAEIRLEHLAHKHARWFADKDRGAFSSFDMVVQDRFDNHVVLFESDYRLASFAQKHEDVILYERPEAIPAQ